MEDVFCKEFDTYENYLYSETHNCCTKIIFELRELDNIMDNVYEIIEVIETIDN